MKISKMCFFFSVKNLRRVSCGIIYHCIRFIIVFYDSNREARLIIVEGSDLIAENDKFYSYKKCHSHWINVECVCPKVQSVVYER